jgi:hypothetical protein
MDVGPWQLTGVVSNVPKMIFIGLAYQYWLAAAHIIGRSSTSEIGKDVADWMTRAFARFAKKSLGDKANVSETVTSDACYPYYYIHRNFLLELLGAQQPVHPQHIDGNAKFPSCPCLFLFGKKKPIKFHDPAWERGLNLRDDCHVR